MRVLHKIIGALLATVSLAPTVAFSRDVPKSEPAGRSPVAAECGRGCLLSVVRDYLLALEAHDASRLPLANGALVYENGKETKLDSGIWRDAKIIANRSTFVDPEAGQAVFLGQVRRDKLPSGLLFVRIKFEKGKITELEQLLAGPDDLLYNPTGLLIPKPMWSDVLPEEERTSAPELRRIADLYFESIARHDPTIVPFHPDCNRTENGTYTTNTTQPNVVTSDSCDIGVTKFGWIPRVRERRFPLVDTARGIVVGISHLDVVPGISSNNGPKSDKAFTFIIYEVFKIVDGQILDIECFMITPPGYPSIWPMKR